MRVSLIIGSAFQAYNAIRVINCDDEIKNAEIDLFFRTNFRNADRILNYLESIGRFSNIYTFTERLPKGIKRKIECAYGALIPNIYCCRKIGKNRLSHYDVVVSGYYTNFTISMVLANPNCRIILYEDGIGSYLPNGYDVFSERIKLYKVLGKKFPEFRPSLLYLNNPECSLSEYRNVIAKIDPSKTNKTNLQDMFQYKQDETYKLNNIIYLSQPPTKKFSAADNIRVENVLKRYNDAILCRLHPNEKDNSKGFEHLDTTMNMWELVCEYEISNNHVLIGIESTAQLTPKLLFDKEPWLVFTYKLYSNSQVADQFDSLNSVMKILQEKYRNKDKILIPETIDELDKVISNLVRSNPI